MVQYNQDWNIRSDMSRVSAWSNHGTNESLKSACCMDGGSGPCVARGVSGAPRGGTSVVHSVVQSKGDRDLVDCLMGGCRTRWPANLRLGKPLCVGPQGIQKPTDCDLVARGEDVAQLVARKQ
eukprot:6432217-Pyramimonas_sp.AAC.1